MKSLILCPRLCGQYWVEVERKPGKFFSTNITTCMSESSMERVISEVRAVRNQHLPYLSSICHGKKMENNDSHQGRFPLKDSSDHRKCCANLDKSAPRRDELWKQHLLSFCFDYNTLGLSLVSHGEREQRNESCFLLWPYLSFNFEGIFR